MSYLAGSAVTYQIAEFLAVMSGLADEASAVRAAVERAAEALEAELGVLLRADAVTAVGFPAGELPEADLRRAAAAPAQGFVLTGVGHCHLAVAGLGEAWPGQLMLGRAGAPFTVEETNLVRAMARVLALSLEMIRTIGAERTLRERSEHQAAENHRLLNTLRERQRLVDALAAIEGAISRRVALPEILKTITSKARDLLEGDSATLRVIDADCPDDLLLVAASGFSEESRAQLWRLPIVEAQLSGLALACGDVVAVPDPNGPVDAAAPARPDGRELPDGQPAAIAAPVHEGGTLVGSLMVACSRPGRRFTTADRQVMRAFAEHVSLALTDAKTVQEMRQAFHDALTGLASRQLFLDRLAHQLAASARDGGTVGLLFIDLDRFKPVNDTLGHGAGDELLIEVGARIQRCLRAGDTAARFGGDEFAALLSEITMDEAITISDRISEEIRKPFHILGKQVFVNASIGVALGAAGQHDATELLRNADVAMYRAKRRGEGHREIFEPAMHAELMARMQMEADLREALAKGEFDVYYQPIVSIVTGHIRGFEALIRWRHPEHGLITPGDFVPLAEETGIILPIGRWILEQACRQGRDWQQRTGTYPPVVMHVNLSMRQLQQPEFAAEVAEVLAGTGLPAERLVLEITETVLHQDTETIVKRLHALKELGVRLAIDDFGTGYFSLSSLRRFPADILKIDKSFVEGLAERADTKAFTHTIVRLGQMLHLDTIAEGIETAEQLGQLRNARCRYGQGHHFAPPLVAAEADATLMAAVEVYESPLRRPLSTWVGEKAEPSALAAPA